MKKIRFSRSAGYVYDLMFIFFVKFNSDLFLSDVSAELFDDVKQSIDRFPEQFGEVADDLYIFFHTGELGNSFLIRHYFEPYFDKFENEYDFGFLISELQNKENLKRNMIRHYFSALKETEIETCMEQDAVVFDYIKSSNYSGEEKSRLYEFFINPDSYIDLLTYELSLKEIALSEYYNKNYHKAITVSEDTTSKALCERLELDPDAEISCSFCLLNKYLVYVSMFKKKTKAFIILGTKYKKSFEFFADKRTGQDLNTLGEMLAEKNRVNILEFIMKRGEITRKDLESEFAFSGSTAYHHLSAMLKAGMILSRADGKVMLYRVNEKYFDTAIELLMPYSSGDFTGDEKYHKKDLPNGHI